MRAALAVSDMSVRAKLMFALATLLLKSNHPPEAVVDAVVACALPRSAGVAAFVWAQKTLAKGEAT